MENAIIKQTHQGAMGSFMRVKYWILTTLFVESFYMSPTVI